MGLELCDGGCGLALWVVMDWLRGREKMVGIEMEALGPREWVL